MGTRAEGGTGREVDPSTIPAGEVLEEVNLRRGTGPGGLYDVSYTFTGNRRVMWGLPEDAIEILEQQDHAETTEA